MTFFEILLIPVAVLVFIGAYSAVEDMFKKH